MTTAEEPRLPDLPGMVEEPEPGGPVEHVTSAEVMIGGKRVDPFATRVCAHLRFTQQIVVARIEDPATHEHRGWAVKVKLRCGECACPVRFMFDTARPSATDGDLGLVVDIEPAPGAQDEPWPAVGGITATIA